MDEVLVASAQRAIEAEGARYRRRVLHFGGVGAAVLVVGIVLLFTADGENGDRESTPVEDAAAIVTTAGIFMVGSVAWFWAPFPPLARRSIDLPLGEGTVAVRTGRNVSRLLVDAPDGQLLLGRKLAGRGKGMPDGEVPALLFGTAEPRGKVVAVVGATGGEPWVAGATGLRRVTS